jgi:hypothetical protein
MLSRGAFAQIVNRDQEPPARARRAGVSRVREGERTVPSQRRRLPTRLWAYAYTIVPAQPEDRLDPIRTIVDAEGLAGPDAARVWSGRLVLEPETTHILIVSDSPAQHLAVNHKLETELRRLEADFVMTEPMAIPGEPADLEGPPPE